jgi:hypothetical protein
LPENHIRDVRNVGYKAVEKAAARTGLSFGEAMRMLAGANVCAEEDEYEDIGRDWSQVIAGPWLAETLTGLRDRDGLETLVEVNTGSGFNGKLRPYQQVGVRWLYLLAKLGFGFSLLINRRCPCPVRHRSQKITCRALTLS